MSHQIVSQIEQALKANGSMRACEVAMKIRECKPRDWDWRKFKRNVHSLLANMAYRGDKWQRVGWGTYEPILQQPTRRESATTTGTKTMCEICQNWPRGVAEENPLYAKLKTAEGLPLLPNHHPQCPHYNDSLMDAYKVTADGVSCFVESLEDAHETAGPQGDDDGDGPVIEHVRIHREVFENLAEFEGF